MIKILVAYSSYGGNTERLAKAVKEGVESSGCSCIIKRVSDVVDGDFKEADGIIAGSPTYFGNMTAELKDMFERFVSLRRAGGMEGKIGAAFTTSGHPSGGKETTMLAIIHAFLIYGMIVVGDPISSGGHYGVACSGSPSQKDLDDAKKLGMRVGELAKKLAK
ncbi:MAG: NAD(P)H-dependent oxidoreductase [bacterium]